MDLCRTIIVAMLSLIALQMSERLSYDHAHGLHLAAAAATTARA